jgi:hypothetical protein
MEYPNPPDKSKPQKEQSAPKGEDLKANNSTQRPRKRVSQACDQCRSRKDKCDGRKPACSTCTAHGRTCSYNTNVKKRGLPEGYVRGLEKLWGLAIRDVRGVEDNVLLALAGDGQNDAFFGDWNDEGASDNVVEVWRKSKISKELERLLSNPEPPSETRKRKHTDSASQAEDGNYFPARSNSQDLVAKPSQSDLSDKKLDIYPNDSFPQSAEPPRTYDDRSRSPGKDESIPSLSYQHGDSSKRSALNVGCLNLPSEVWNLTELYFSYTHPWFPIIGKQDILQTTYRYLRKASYFSTSTVGCGSQAVLWAVMAYAKFQYRTINNIRHGQRPLADTAWTAERMYANARNFIPDEDGVFELGHVQALLILALTNIGNGHLSRAWLLIGQAVRIAIDMGLGRPSDDILMALKAPSRAKHVFLGCFVLDTIIASRLGHRPHLRTEDVEQVGLVEEEGIDESDPCLDWLMVCPTNLSSRPSSALSTFNRLVKLLQILNEAACEWDGPRQMQSSTDLLAKLDAWKQAQPSLQHLETAAVDSKPHTTLLPHHYNLRLAYFNTLATLQLMSHGQGKESINLEPSIRSARQIVDLLIQHSNNFGLLIIPPTFEYFLKVAYDVVRQVRSIEETEIDIASWKHNLDTYVDMIEPTWPVFRSFKSSILYQAAATGRRASQVAFELISGTSNAKENPQIVSVPNNPRSDDTDPQVYRRGPGVLMNNGPALHQTQSIDFPISHQFMATNHPTARSLFSTDNHMAINSRSVKNLESEINSAPNLTTPPPHLQHGTSTAAEPELDPMFQEFAALDATKWYSDNPLYYSLY